MTPSTRPNNLVFDSSFWLWAVPTQKYQVASGVLVVILTGMIDWTLELISEVMAGAEGHTPSVETQHC